MRAADFNWTRSVGPSSVLHLAVVTPGRGSVINGNLVWYGDADRQERGWIIGCDFEFPFCFLNRGRWKE